MFTETRLKGAFIIELERREDERAFYAPVIAQPGMRGMHFQFPPAAETKLDLAVRRRS